MADNSNLLALESNRMVLDGHKMIFHLDRVRDWLAGKRIAPITVDLALTRKCNFHCQYCFSQLQENPGKELTLPILCNLADDLAEVGVRGVSLISDGESTVHPHWVEFVNRLKGNGLDVGMATNGFAISAEQFQQVLPALSYLRFNISAAEATIYGQIHGVAPTAFFQVMENIRTAIRLKRERGLEVTIGLQMVLTKECVTQAVPLAKLGGELGCDYTVIKHCSDSERGELGVDNAWLASLEDTLKRAEEFSTPTYVVRAKWSKLLSKGQKKFSRCYGIPFMMQFSGSGLVAPCGFLFNQRYVKYHIGNVADTRFRDIFRSERYWDVIALLASEEFDPHTMCGTSCLQFRVNEFLWDVVHKTIDIDKIQVPEEKPLHVNFV